MGIGSSFKKFVSNPKRVATAAVTLGGSEVWRGLAKPLFGKKDEGSPERYTPLEAEQKKALGLYDQEINRLKEFDPNKLARIQTTLLENQERASADDAERQAQEIVARRGLGKSSVGLGAILGAKRDIQNRINTVRANEPILQQGFEGERLARIGDITGGINNIFGQRMYTPAVAGGARIGGLIQPLLGIGGAALAAKYGQNPLSGYQIGSGLGQSVQNYRG